MVHLVLQAYREETLDLFLIDRSLLVLPAGANLIRAQHFGILLGYGQTALGVRYLIVRMPQDLRVDEKLWVPEHRTFRIIGILRLLRSITSSRIGSPTC